MPITRLLIANRGEIAIALAWRQPIWVCAPSPFIRATTRARCMCAPPTRCENCRARGAFGWDAGN